MSGGLCSPARLAAPSDLPSGSGDNPWTVEERTDPIVFEQFQQLVQTGDLFIEYGKGFFARMIEWVGGTQYSHVALIDRAVYPDGSEMPFVFESVRHADGCHDALTGRPASGVRVVELGERVRAMASAGQGHPSTGAIRIGVIRLLIRRPEDRGHMTEMLHRCEAATISKPYERQLLEMAKSVFPKLLGNPLDDARSFDCAELVMNTLKTLRIVRATLPDGKPVLSTVRLQVLTSEIAHLPFAFPEDVAYENRMVVYHVLPPGVAHPGHSLSTLAALQLAPAPSAPPSLASSLAPSLAAAPAPASSFAPAPAPDPAPTSSFVPTPAYAYSLPDAYSLPPSTPAAAPAPSSHYHHHHQPPPPPQEEYYEQFYQTWQPAPLVPPAQSAPDASSVWLDESIGQTYDPSLATPSNDAPAVMWADNELL